jgi:hypothetical protein
MTKKESQYQVTCDGAKIRRNSTAVNGGNTPRLGST